MIFDPDIWNAGSNVKFTSQSSTITGGKCCWRGRCDLEWSL